MSDSKVREIAAQIIKTLEMDNGCKFYPVLEVKTRLRNAVKAALESGFEFTDEVIIEMTSGDEEDRDKLFGQHSFWPDLDLAIDDVFESETDCSHEIVVDGYCDSCGESV